MTDLNSFQSINLSQFFDSVKFQSGSGYYLVIDFCIVMFYIIKISTKFGVAPQRFLWKSKFCSGSGFGSGLWFYFGFQYQTYVSYIEDTPQILFGSANSFDSYCVHMKSPWTYVLPDIQTDRQTEIFFCLFCLPRHTKHEHSSKGENFFFSLMRLQYFLFLHTQYVMTR